MKWKANGDFVQVNNKCDNDDIRLGILWNHFDYERSNDGKDIETEDMPSGHNHEQYALRQRSGHRNYCVRVRQADPMENWIIWSTHAMVDAREISFSVGVGSMSLFETNNKAKNEANKTCPREPQWLFGKTMANMPKCHQRYCHRRTVAHKPVMFNIILSMSEWMSCRLVFC